jgi:hypothetical protein
VPERHQKHAEGEGEDVPNAPLRILVGRPPIDETAGFAVPIPRFYPFGAEMDFDIAYLDPDAV